MNKPLILAAALAVAPLGALAHGETLPVQQAGKADNEIVVVRDAETGRLRAATADEKAVLDAQRLNRRQALRSSAAMAPITPQLKLHHTGATGVRLTDDMASFSVMVRAADGKLVEMCFASKEEAEAAVKKGLPQPKSDLPTE